MKTILIMIAAIGLCAALNARAQNIVTNGSFEDGTLGTTTTLTNSSSTANWITGWDLYQGSPTNSVTNSLTLVSGGTEGANAARYSVQSTPGSQANQVGFRPSAFIPVSLASGSNFTFSLDLKRVDAGLADFRWVVFQRNSSNTLIGSPTTFNWAFSSITTNWQTFTTNLALDPAIANLELQFRYIPAGAFTSATLDIDNIQVVPEPSTLGLLGAAGLGTSIFLVVRRRRGG
jgi:hypothetical protein